MAGDIERHLLAVDGIQIQLGGDDRLLLVDWLDDVFAVRGPIIALPPRSRKASGSPPTSVLARSPGGKSFTRITSPAASTKQRASNA